MAKRSYKISKEDSSLGKEKPDPLNGDGSSSGPYLFVATYLPLKKYRTVIPFLRLSMKITKQLRNSQGIVRFVLRTNLPRKTFWTISVWTQRESMASFSRSEPHRTAVQRFFTWGTDKAAIAEWSSSKMEIDWAEAESRLKEPLFRYATRQGRLVHAPGSRSVTEGTEE